MKNRIALTMFGLLMVTTCVGAARAQILDAITLTDTDNNSIGTVTKQGDARFS